MVQADQAAYGFGVVLHLNGKEWDGLSIVAAKRGKTGELATRFQYVHEYHAAEWLYGGKIAASERAVWYAVQAVSHQWAQQRTSKNHDTAQLASEFAALTKQFPALEWFICPSARFDAPTPSRNNLIPLTISSEAAEVVYHFEHSGTLCRATGRLKIGSKEYAADSHALVLTPLFVLHKHTLFPYRDRETAAAAALMATQPSMAMPATRAAEFQAAVLQPLSRCFKIKGRDFNTKKKLSENDLSFEKQVYVRDVDGLIRFSPAAQYADTLIELPGHGLRLRVENGQFRQLPRNEAAEQAFLSFFQTLHPDFAHVSDGLYQLAPEQLLQDFWFIEFADTLQNHGVTLLGAKELKSWSYNLHKPKISINAESGADWFDLKADIHYGDQAATLKDIQKAFVKKQNFVQLSDGSRGILPANWLEKFAPYFQAGDVKKDRIRLSHFQFGIIDTLFEHLEDTPDFLRTLYERKQRLQNLSTLPDIQLSDGLQATLRPYQQHGLNWLAFLHANGLGGCLADDMGLGKTLQTIAFLHYLKTTHTPEHPSLIVASTSLVFNWQAEVEKFCPSLRVLDYTGAGRLKNTDAFKDYDLILTTYGTLIQDIDLLSEYPFYYVILDESQAIKNPLSQRYKAARLLQAAKRLILSGTPIENNTFDLYAQLNFLNPGLLGSQNHFKSTFANEVDKHQNADTAALLAKMVNPFILRRTKQQVAHELPPKTESVIYCEMDEAQRQVYERVKAQYRAYLLDKIDSDGIKQSQIHILEGLTRLRQICNSPALLDDADYGSASVKLDTLMENIKEKTGRHKILVFSSFVKMLALIEGRLKAENIAYEYLDGQTRKRQQKVDNFQNNPEIRVFLISTKAGGTGLNLTEADYVFITDPWWNPAVENQAIDRCYRIGQTKQVMAYRMICRNSIEEKILALQQKKQGIADSLISIDNEQKTFDLEEVKQLFA